MHFGDSIFIFLLALVLFGPKKLPEIGRQIGKLLAEFRRASNEFKLQIDDELRAMEQQERQKQLEQAASQPAAATTANVPATEMLPHPVVTPPNTGEPVSRTAWPSAPMPTANVDPDYVRAVETEEMAARDAAEHSAVMHGSTTHAETAAGQSTSESEQAQIHHG